MENLRDESTADLRIGNIAIVAIRDEVDLRERKDIIGTEEVTETEFGVEIVDVSIEFEPR